MIHPGPAVHRKPVRLADPPQLLAGRENMLADLDARLTTGDHSWPRTVVLCGFGGVGKTSVALAYAHRRKDELGAVWQFTAQDGTVLAAGFGELAAQLGVRDTDDPDPVASVHAALAASSSPWLLIFDNAPSSASVEAFRPPAGHGWVLITSQNQNWPPGLILDVPVLSRDAAADFLVNRTGDPDTNASLDLAGELDGLPLALEQAAAYIQATGDTVQGFVKVGVTVCELRGGLGVADGGVSGVPG